MKECPICKKNFYPAPEHAWKIAKHTRDGGKIVCSYHCVREWERTQEAKKEQKTKNKCAYVRRFLTVNGETQSVNAWAVSLSMRSATIYNWVNTKGETYATQRLAERLEAKA